MTFLRKLDSDDNIYNTSSENFDFAVTLADGYGNVISDGSDYFTISL
jgi:hypothetical protein